MGTSYQTVLATGELARIRAALEEARWEAYVAPAGAQRWAVVPREENDFGWADRDAVAELVSRSTGSPAVSFDIFDSDVLRARIFVDGAATHGYVSDRSYVSEYWDNDDNEFLAGFDGTLYPVDAPPPPGPDGADPVAFAPVGVGEVDPARLGAALRGEVPFDDAPRLFAERQHAAILAALNLDIHPLTEAFRHFDPADFPHAVHIAP
ncbi:hypothetical protein ABZ671_21240 [Micromonospora sp. NPDC006766]|uniref:hypothetical protein n=1 Tax=Micromonospora sp. NPDC006766 TaxID=3154778 RepID=UPI00340C23F8